MSEFEDLPYKWVKSSNGRFPQGALVGGNDINGEVLYVARAYQSGDLIPGKLVPSHGHAYVSWRGLEFKKTEYEVLVGVAKAWIHTSGSNTPPATFPGGHTQKGEKLFVGRVTYQGATTPGKIQESERLCYIPFGGKEIRCSEYEALIY